MSDLSTAPQLSCRKVPSTTEGLAFKNTGCISPETDAAPQDASYSVAGFHAKDPQHDQHIMQVWIISATLQAAFHPVAKGNSPWQASRVCGVVERSVDFRNCFRKPLADNLIFSSAP